eukprot:2283625-Amphidinium_carterae.1
MASCVAALLYNNMQSLACIVVTDHLRFHFIAASPVGITLLLQTRDMGSASRAKPFLYTIYEVAKASKSCSHKQGGSKRRTPAHESMREQQQYTQPLLGDQRGNLEALELGLSMGYGSWNQLESLD